jgi:hypothetical protein
VKTQKDRNPALPKGFTFLARLEKDIGEPAGRLFKRNKIVICAVFLRTVALVIAQGSFSANTADRHYGRQTHLPRYFRRIGRFHQ